LGHKECTSISTSSYPGGNSNSGITTRCPSCSSQGFFVVLAGVGRLVGRGRGGGGGGAGRGRGGGGGGAGRGREGGRIGTAGRSGM